jgi:quercetin dioxygenase-like cupin family protein
MRRISIVAAVVMFSTAVSVAGAVATPPTGDLKFEDFARAQAVEGASVPITPNSSLVRGEYAVGPGGGTGWRSLPGTMVLAVTKGKLTLQGGDGCATKDYATGQAAVMPKGVYQVRNTGRDPLEFFGLFFEQTAGAPKPLAEGPTAAAPADCTGVMASSVAPSGVSLAGSAAAPFVTSFYTGSATVEIKAGQDVFATHYDAAPGWSSGWFAHRPAVNIMEAGELSYVEAKGGKCDETEVYKAGEAFYHPAHRHMAVNEGKEHTVLTTVYFDVPHGAPLPGPGNQLAAADFSQAPPADCPRLR